MTADKDPSYLAALVADRHGDVFELEEYAAAGMSGDRMTVLAVDNTVGMPHGSELMMLPDRIPILFHKGKRRFEPVAENPNVPGEPVYPVAAFNSPGYVTTSISAYVEGARSGWLPLFSYGAVGWYRGRFRSAIFQVDRERRQDLRRM